MANDEAMGLKGSKKDPTRTAQQAVDRRVLDAVVTLFLLRDGLVLPDEFAEPLITSEELAQHELCNYAELAGLLKAAVAEKAHDRVSYAEDEG